MGLRALLVPALVFGTLALQGQDQKDRAIGEFAGAAEVIPYVEEDRPIGVHEALAVEPLLHDAAGGVPFFSDLHAVPEVFLVAGDLKGLGGVGPPAR